MNHNGTDFPERQGTCDDELDCRRRYRQRASLHNPLDTELSRKIRALGKVRFTDLKSTNHLGGRPTTVALLNEQQATFLITLLRNNDIVLDFKSELVDRFWKMLEILLNQRNEEWRQFVRRAKLATVQCATPFTTTLSRLQEPTVQPRLTNVFTKTIKRW